jgi:predicted alpha/beta superfamily hydrolase
MSSKTIPMNGLFDAEYFDIESTIVNDTFRIFVGKPSTIEPDKLYPSIFALDGNAAFASLLGTQRLLTQGGEVPASIVIAVGYPGDSLATAMLNRNRDYTPTEPGETEIRALGANSKAGATSFLRFIQEELKPALYREYPLDPEEDTLQGTSLGGLFAAWVLLTEPLEFQKYILCSPAIWWKNEEVWQWEESLAAKHDDLSATVFIGAGALEVEEPIRAHAIAIAEKNPMLRTHIEGVIDWNDSNGWPEVALLTPEFANRLQSRNYPGLNIHCHNMPDENHMSAPPSLTSRGLRFVNGSWAPL